MSTRPLRSVLEEGGGSIKTGPFGTVLSAAEYSDDGVPLISVGEIGYGEIRLRSTTPRIGNETLSRLPDYLLQAGDIVVGRKGGVDRSALIRDAEAGWFLGSDGIRVRFGPNVDAAFMAYYLLTPNVREWLLRHAGGSTLKSLNEPTLGAVPVRAPQIGEQRAIAEVLGALDDKIAANAQMHEIADELATALWRRISSMSETSHLTYAQVAEIGGGGTPSTREPSFWGGNVRWASPTDITALDAPYLDRTSKGLTAEGLAACSSALYPARSVLMTSRATIGSFAMAMEPTAVNQGFIVARAREPLGTWWLFHEMRSRVADYVSHANGATFLELPRGRFKGLEVRWPGDEALTKFDAQAQPLHARAYSAMVENRKLAELRDALLPELMSGRLRVKDAEKSVEEVV